MKTVEQLWQGYHAEVLRGTRCDRPEVMAAFFAAALLALHEQYQRGGPVDPDRLLKMAHEHVDAQRLWSIQMRSNPISQ